MPSSSPADTKLAVPGVLLTSVPLRIVPTAAQPTGPRTRPRAADVQHPVPAQVQHPGDVEHPAAAADAPITLEPAKLPPRLIVLPVWLNVPPLLHDALFSVSVPVVAPSVPLLEQRRD